MEENLSGIDDWMQKAACRNQSTANFFILRGDPQQRVKRIEAYQICKGCPVQRECLDYAIINHELGIWGGTTDRERRIIRRNWTPLSEKRMKVKGYSQFA
jgi:WhiB family redox-sensing transcriptional regulator